MKGCDVPLSVAVTYGYPVAFSGGEECSSGLCSTVSCKWRLLMQPPPYMDGKHRLAPSYLWRVPWVSIGSLLLHDEARGWDAAVFLVDVLDYRFPWKDWWLPQVGCHGFVSYSLHDVLAWLLIFLCRHTSAGGQPFCSWRCFQADSQFVHPFVVPHDGMQVHKCVLMFELRHEWLRIRSVCITSRSLSRCWRMPDFST